MRGTTVRLIICSAATLFLSSACYRYVPMETAAAVPGEPVRVYVTQAGTEGFREVYEVDQALPRVRGTVVGRDAGDLLLAVEVARRQVGFQAVGLEQTLRIPEGEILATERRSLNGLATSAFAGVVAGGVAAILSFILESEGEAPPPEPEVDLMVPLISVPVGR
ncbi:MAG: hypothetical protein F4151_17105 [Gammaproteobacteria bacterium]|nr:hypothetical protein [Gammaproteobacteria bacterium]